MSGPGLPAGYALAARCPDLADYLRLRAAAGLSPRAPAAAEAGLKGTRHAVLALHGDRVVGMCRLIGDGGCFFQVVDVAVDPAHQGRGLGRALMAALMEHVRATLPPTAHVSLIADVPANRLYEDFGFRETAPRSVAMALGPGPAPGGAEPRD